MEHREPDLEMSGKMAEHVPKLVTTQRGVKFVVVHKDGHRKMHLFSGMHNQHADIARPHLDGFVGAGFVNINSDDEVNARYDSDSLRNLVGRDKPENETEALEVIEWVRGKVRSTFGKKKP